MVDFATFCASRGITTLPLASFKRQQIQHFILRCCRCTFSQGAHDGILFFRERCQKGATQNRDESFNGLVWQLCPKTGFESAATAKTAVSLAVVWLNDGGKWHMSSKKWACPLVFSHTARVIKLLDHGRSAHAAGTTSEKGKRSRKKCRRIRKGIQDQNEEEEGVMYEAGGF